MSANYFLFSYMMLFFSALVANESFASISIQDEGRTHFRQDYIYVEEIDAFVKIHTNKKTWYDAKDYCEAEGTGLAVIGSLDEATAIKNVCNTNSSTCYNLWIGLHDIVSEGKFETIYGEPMSKEFKGWAKGEPNNARPNEDCVRLTEEFTYFDEDCFSTRPFICKIDGNQITENPDCDNFDSEYKPVLSGKQCIKFHKTPRTWEEANMICTEEEAHLAFIDSPEEVVLYANEFAKYPASLLQGYFNKHLLHVEFHDNSKKDNFKINHDQLLSGADYEKRSDKLRRLKNDREVCGSMLRNGKLSTSSCNFKAMFICEKESSNR